MANPPYHKSYDNRNRDSKPKPQRQEMDFPKDYVDFADQTVEKYLKSVKFFEQITTTKLRNILSMLMDVYNVEKPDISEESVVMLQMARIRLAYECGRDPKITKRFVEETSLLSWLKAAGHSRQKVLDYIHYVEALVAYHRYHGGKD